jgi:hypothetical protein
MENPEAVMEILEAYDLTGSFRAATGLVGVRSQDGGVLGASA